MARVTRPKADFTLHLDGEKYNVSKFLFASYSEKFRSELLGLSEYRVEEHFDPATFRQFCNACQGYPYLIYEGNIEEMLRIAEHFGCKSVEEACQARQPRDLVDLIKGSTDEKCLANVVDRLDEYLKMPQAMKLSSEQVVQVLVEGKKRGKISDQDVIEFVISYAKRHRENAHVGEALAHVDLRNISIQELRDCIALEQYPETVDGKVFLELLAKFRGSSRRCLGELKLRERLPVQPTKEAREIWLFATWRALDRENMREIVTIKTDDEQWSEDLYEVLGTKTIIDTYKPSGTNKCHIEFQFEEPVEITKIEWSFNDYWPKDFTLVFFGERDGNKPSSVVKRSDYNVGVKSPLIKNKYTPTLTKRLVFTQTMTQNSEEEVQEDNSISLQAFDVKIRLPVWFSKLVYGIRPARVGQ